MKDYPPMPGPCPERDFDALLSHVLAPFLSGKEPLSPGPDLPGQALAALDRIENFSIPGSSILGSRSWKEWSPFLPSLVKAEDRIEKRGRSLLFSLAGPRRFRLEPVSLDAVIEGPFSLAFGTAASGFPDPAISERLQKALAALPGAGGIRPRPDEVLAAAVLPQEKRWLGVHTPVGIEILGLRFNLRFLMAAGAASGSRLFVAGPMVKEISLRSRS